MNTTYGNVHKTPSDAEYRYHPARIISDSDFSLPAPLPDKNVIVKVKRPGNAVDIASENECSWKKTFLQIGTLLLAIGISLAHHFYYSWLNSQVAGTTNRQQWSIRIGSTLATGVVLLLKAAVGFAYVQLLWLVFRKKPIRVSDIDALFKLKNADIPAFFSTGVWTTGTIVVPIAIIIVVLPVAAIFPPATLSVSLQRYTSMTQENVLQFYYSTSGWACAAEDDFCNSETVEKIGIQAAEGGNILNLYQPAPNSSYNLKFEGPSLSCMPPNLTQNAVFDHYDESYGEYALSVALPFINSTKFNRFFVEDGSYGTVYWSAFVAPGGNDGRANTDLGDAYWNREFDDPLVFYWPKENIKTSSSEQIWIQTFDQRLICTVMVSDFDVNVTYDRGSQAVSYNRVNHRRIFWGPSPGFFGPGEPNVTLALAFSHMVGALTKQLVGNVTFSSDLRIEEFDSRSPVSHPGPQSNVLSTKLAACPELNWTSVLHSASEAYPAEYSTKLTDNQTRIDVLLAAYPSQPEDCRNGSLARAIEDLMNNITVSMLSSEHLTINTTTSVQISTNQIIYTYSSTELIISYAIAIGVATIVFLISILAIKMNGMVHDSSFSALVATTRNPELCKLFSKENAAGYPVSQAAGERKLRFGRLRSHQRRILNGGMQENEEISRSAAFGTEDELIPFD